MHLLGLLFQDLLLVQVLEGLNGVCGDDHAMGRVGGR